MSNKAPKLAQLKKQRQKETRKKARISLTGIVLGLATLIGVPAAVLNLLPRISVTTPSSPVDPNNVLSVSFDISNTGYVPLSDVEVRLAAGDIIGPQPGGALRGILKKNGAPAFNLIIELVSGKHHYLGIDDKLTINPESQIGGQVEGADIAVIVSYKPWFLPIRRQKLFRFLTTKDRMGNTYWRSWPTNEPAPIR